MKTKRSPYNKTSGMSKEIMKFFMAYPTASDIDVAKTFGRSIDNVRYLKGVANGNN